MREKGVKLLQAQKLVQYLRECEDVMDWINDKVCLRGRFAESVCGEKGEGDPPDLHPGARVSGTGGGGMAVSPAAVPHSPL